MEDTIKQLHNQPYGYNNLIMTKNFFSDNLTSYLSSNGKRNQDILISRCYDEVENFSLIMKGDILPEIKDLAQIQLICNFPNEKLGRLSILSSQLNEKTDEYTFVCLISNIICTVENIFPVNICEQTISNYFNTFCKEDIFFYTGIQRRGYSIFLFTIGLI